MDAGRNLLGLGPLDRRRAAGGAAQRIAAELWPRRPEKGASHDDVRPLALCRRAVPLPATALLVAGREPAELLAICAAGGRSLGCVFEVTAGWLLVLDRPVTEVVPGTVRLRGRARGTLPAGRRGPYVCAIGRRGRGAGCAIAAWCSCPAAGRSGLIAMGRWSSVACSRASPPAPELVGTAGAPATRGAARTNRTGSARATAGGAVQNP